MPNSRLNADMPFPSARSAAFALALIGAGASLPAQAPTRAGVRYVPGASSEQSLDLYVPDGHPGFPTIVMVHGGGLTSGDKTDDSIPAICATLVAAGIGCASVNYRLGPLTKWPAQPNDVAAAVAWLRHHVADYAGDSTALILLGHSSGCLLASIVGTDPKYLASAGLESRALAGVVAMGCTLSPVLPDVSDSTRLRAFFTGSAALGTFGSLETFLDVDATAHVSAHTPRTLVLVAEAEQVNPPILERARRFEASMIAAGRSVEVDILPDRRHYTALIEMRHADDPTLALVLSFVRRVVRAR